MIRRFTILFHWSFLRPLLLAGGGVILVVVLLFYLAGRLSPQVSTATIAVSTTTAPSRVATVRLVEIPLTETAVGSIRPVHETTLAAQVMAPVKFINLKAGQLVHQGDVLIKLDDKDLKARLQQAQVPSDMDLVLTRKIVLEAVSEIRPPLITATLAVILSFIPMFFITGMMGPYMRPMALNVPVTMIMSMVVAFTITSWMAYHMLKRTYAKGDPGAKGAPDTDDSHDPHDMEAVKQTRLYRFFYPLMAPLLHSRKAVWGFLLVIVLLTLAATSSAATRHVPLKMLPFDNKNELLLVMNFDRGTTLERSDAAVRDMEAYLRTVPEISDYTSYVGVGSPMDFNGMVRHYYLRQGDNVAEIRLNLAAKKNRSLQSHAIGLRIRDDLTAIAAKAGARLVVVETPPGPPVLSSVVAQVTGRADHTYEDLLQTAKTVKDRLALEPGVMVDVQHDLSQQTAAPLNAQFDGSGWVASNAPKPVQGRTFFSNGSDVPWAVPTGTKIDFAGEGEWKITLDVFRDLGLAFAAALVAIYILLVAQTGSFAIPVVVMLAIPLTVSGVMPGFWLLNAIGAHHVGGYLDPIYFTATGMIGMIALSGIVTRDAIILVDFIHLSLRRGRSLFDAIMESRVVRLRLILLTASSAMLGAVPIIFDPIFSGLAWALIFGLFASTLFTLFVIPVCYWLLYTNKPSHGLPPSSNIQQPSATSP